MPKLVSAFVCSKRQSNLYSGQKTHVFSSINLEIVKRVMIVPESRVDHVASTAARFKKQQKSASTKACKSSLPSGDAVLLMRHLSIDYRNLFALEKLTIDSSFNQTRPICALNV